MKVKDFNWVAMATLQAKKQGIKVKGCLPQYLQIVDSEGITYESVLEGNNTVWEDSRLFIDEWNEGCEGFEAA